MKTKISVLINTLNEEKNLPYALRSVKDWADEVIVVDMYSDDRTREIASSFGAKVLLHERTGFVEPARAFAVSQAKNEWVFILDADELVPVELSRTLLDIVISDKTDVVYVPRLNYVFGAPIHHTGWSPDQDKHPRFFKREKMLVGARIHTSLEPKPGASVLTLGFKEHGGLVHFCYLDSIHFIEKLNRYTTIEARQAFERGERRGLSWMLLAVFKEFANRYILMQGYRDGWRGLYITFFMMFYRLAVCEKLKELHTIGDRSTVETGYRNSADAIISKYAAQSSNGFS